MSQSLVTRVSNGPLINRQKSIVPSPAQNQTVDTKGYPSQNTNQNMIKQDAPLFAIKPINAEPAKDSIVHEAVNYILRGNNRRQVGHNIKETREFESNRRKQIFIKQLPDASKWTEQQMKFFNEIPLHVQKESNGKKQFLDESQGKEYNFLKDFVTSFSVLIKDYHLRGNDLLKFAQMLEYEMTKVEPTTQKSSDISKNNNENMDEVDF